MSTPPSEDEHQRQGGEYRLLINASRDWADPVGMWRVLERYWQHAWDQDKALVIVHGDAPGGDQIAKLFGELWPAARQEAHPADWSQCGDRCSPRHRKVNRQGEEYCPAAGMRRNKRMVNAGGDAGAAFIHDGSPGASGCLKLMEQAGIPARAHRS